MAFFINKQPRWLLKALNIAPTEDTGPPNFIPDTISPAVDVLGWQRYDEILYDNVTGAADVLSIFPNVNESWVSVLGGFAAVPPDTLRVIYNVHTEHDDDTDRRTWLVIRDRITLAELKVANDGAGIVQPKFYPTAVTRPILLRTGDTIIGRVQALTLGNKLSMRYSWIDLTPGEYIPHLT